MRFLTRSLLGLFLVAMTIGLLSLAVWSIHSAIQQNLAVEDTPRQARERVFAANVITVEAQAITPVLTAFGEIGSRRTLEIRSAASGMIVELSEDFEDGAAVEAGQVLIRIDPADAQSALDTERTGMLEAQAELREATRALDLAQDDLEAARAQAQLREQAVERQRNLAERNLGTAAERETSELAASTAAQSVLSRRQALAQAEARLDQSRTALERQKIALAEAERRLAETVIRAEFSGVLADVNAVVGRLVSANEQMATLIDPDALETSFRVSTSQYARLLDEDGRLLQAPVEVALDVFGAEILAAGQLTRVSASVGAGLTGRLIFARLDAARGFRPGDFVAVRVAEPELSNVALIPATAIDSGGIVLVVDAEDRLEEMRLDLLRRQGDSVIVSAEGLAGRVIVTERTPLLGAGIKIRPLRPAGEETSEAQEPLATPMIELTPERREQLKAFVQESDTMPDEAKARVLAQLDQDRVPVEMVERIESRMGG